MRSDLPAGTVTFCFTDVEGSTRLLHKLGAEAYAEALAEHRRVVREACARQGGVEVDTQGDAFFFAFPTAPGALAAASAFTEALASGPIQVRCGLHTGTPHRTSEGYVGADVHRAARIASAGHGGQVVVSAATAELVETPLGTLGSHRLKDVESPVSLFQLGEGSFPPLKTIANSNLPTPASSFLGREDELYETDLLLEQTRLLTIHGPGGQGKTRFALELARRAREERFSDYPDGVFSCLFSSLRDPSLVLATIAQTLSVREQPGQSALEALSSHLQGKKLLLLLDNLEHLLEAAPELSQLLERAAGLTLLVTSREVLRLQGETSYALPPLPEDESVALVCERARTEPTPEIAELARRLEGLPLALELAAARLSILTPKQLLERLSQRLDLLKGGRDADPRQQTLRATIEWSYDLLTEEEQRLFRALSVFSGGCTLEAAEEVCDADLDSLQSLVDKSLLRFSEERFWMLETLRAYAAERLAEAGEAEALRDRHADHYLAFAEEHEPPQIGGVDQVWLARFRPETDNLRAAIASLAEQPDSARELRLVGSLFRFWPMAGLLAEGRRLAEHALARGKEPSLRIKALYTAAVCAGYAGDLDAVESIERERLALADTVGDHVSAAVALYDIARVAELRGSHALATSSFARSAVLAESIGEEMIAVNTRATLALALVQSGEDTTRGVAELRALLGRAEELGDVWTLAQTLESLGSACYVSGELDEAAECFARVLAGASVFPLESVFFSLIGASALAHRAGHPRSAARLEGAFRAHTTARGFSGLILAAGFEGAVGDATREALGDREYEAAVETGESMSVDEAIAYALATLAPSGK